MEHRKVCRVFNVFEFSWGLRETVVSERCWTRLSGVPWKDFGLRLQTFGLGMDPLVIGCTGYRMPWEHERYYGLSMDAMVIGGVRNTNVLWFEHGCIGYGTNSEHERYCGLSMDALVTARIRNTNLIMVSAWMLWLSDAFGTRMLLWFEHGCSGYRTHSEQQKYCGLRRNASVSSVYSGNTGRIRNTNVIMVSAWMLWLSDAFGTAKILWLAQECFCFLLYTLGTRTLVWFEHGCSVTVTRCTGNTNVIVVWA